MTAQNALFFYGTLRHLPLLEVVVGRIPEHDTARLRDHEPRSISGEVFPAIHPRDGAIAEGLVVWGLSAEERERIDFYEGPGDYSLSLMDVETDGGGVRAEVFVASEKHMPPGDPWSYEAWLKQHSAVSVETAREAMMLSQILTDAEFDAAYPTMISRADARLRAASEPAPAEVRGSFARRDVDVIDERRPYTKYFAVAEQDLRFRQFSGGMSAEVTRAAFIGGDAVTLLPYDPARDRVLLIEQFRFGPHMRGDPRPWLLEPIAGRIDPGETPEATARREALEEARLVVGDLHEVARYYPSPGTLAEFLVSYIGIADLPDGSAVVAGEDSEAEDIKGHLLSLERLMDLVATGEAGNGPLILSAQWIALNRTRLQASS